MPHYVAIHQGFHGLLKYLFAGIQNEKGKSFLFCLIEMYVEYGPKLHIIDGVVYFPARPEVIKLFPCSTQLSMKFQKPIKTEIQKNKEYSQMLYLSC